MAASGPHITETEWSHIAPGMAQMVAAGPGVAPAKHMAEHSNSLLPFSSLDALVVDMGCGPGQVTNAVLEQYRDQLAKKVIGADNNPQMLEQYNSRQKGEIAKGNTYWEHAESKTVDIHDCAGLADDSVSHMLCGFIVFLIPEPGKAIASMHRVMAPGGVLAMSSLASAEWVKLANYPTQIRPDLAGPFGPSNGCSAPGEVRAHLEKAGFRDIETLEVQSYMEFNDYEFVTRFILNRLPQATRAVAKMTNDEIIQTQEKMIADLKSWHPELPARMLGKVNIAYCRK
ncbi:S-adenosyl-L-methionine-dependent methyltransferase [Xylariaceae sp. FL0255]|nr:S-adenosyl-L-methionine-dependent methyltransferase [Xylariaceae sp. FL0255]